MNEEQARRDSVRQDALKREMLRESLDLIRVYNPTDKDFTILWDGFKHVVPNKNKDAGYGKGQRVVQRYLAKWYLKHMTDYIINTKADIELQKIKDAYEKDGIEDSLLKANQLIERKREYRTDNAEEIAKIAEIIWLGIEEKYGIDQIESEQEQHGIQDQRPVHEQIADTLKNKRARPVEATQNKEETTEYPINKAKKKLAEEVQS